MGILSLFQEESLFGCLNISNDTELTQTHSWFVLWYCDDKQMWDTLEEKYDTK